MSSSRFRELAYSPETFCWLVAEASRRDPGGKWPDQVTYLARYLADPEIAAKWMLVEDAYIDRHYIEEFTGYYASAFRPPPSVATRLHFFRQEVELGERVRAAAAGDRALREQCGMLQSSYIGFTVVRPIPSCPIGRTILMPYPEGDRRYAKLAHHVHIAGLDLRIEGVPFQQQDQAVGACATTAVWSALAQVNRTDGGRAPTPFAITKAATRQLVRNRTFPAAEGLSVEQIAGAVRDGGYSPHCFSSHDAVQEFKLAVKCYLRSGIPVILITAGDPGHAYTAVGFRERDDTGDPADLIVGEPHGRHVRSAGMSRLYVHDDRHGPYVRMQWLAPDEDSTYPRLEVKPPEVDHPPERIRLGIAPLYPKLRLSATDLIACANEFWPAVRRQVAPEDADELRVELRYALGGRYLRNLVRNAALSPDRVARFVQAVKLPRYVGVAAFSVRHQLLADAIFDTTDINRPHPTFSPLLAIVPYAETLQPYFAKVSESYAPDRVCVA